MTTAFLLDKIHTISLYWGTKVKTWYPVVDDLGEDGHPGDVLPRVLVQYGLGRGTLIRRRLIRLVLRDLWTVDTVCYRVIRDSSRLKTTQRQDICAVQS